MSTETLELQARLASLGLHYSAENLCDLAARATKGRMGPVQMLEYLCDLEEQERARRSLERRHARSKLGRFKAMADFDWAWPTKVDRKAIHHARVHDQP